MADMEVDPSAQVHTLSQALANQSTHLGFMLGAGCPCSIKRADGGPLIPAIAELTSLIYEQLGSSAHSAAFGALEQQYDADGEELPNVEDLLSRIRTLREVVGTRSPDGLGDAELAALQIEICSQIAGVVAEDLPEGVTSYAMFARWISEVQRHEPIEVFTTNYDLLLEKALERRRAPFFDGFVGTHEPFFDVSAMELDVLPRRWTRVWKVHGSINWRLREQNLVVRSLSGDLTPLVYPSHLKYAQSRRLPYLAMRDRLRTFLKARAVLITCGYSFADEHLNEDIVFGLTASPASVCFCLLYGPIGDYAHVRELAMARPNLNVLARDGGVVRGRPVRWPADKPVTLGDFAAFGSFLIHDVMGESDENA